MQVTRRAGAYSTSRPFPWTRRGGTRCRVPPSDPLAARPGRCRPRRGLEDGEVRVLLVGRDAGPVVVPLQPLVADEPLEDLLAQRLTDELAALHLLDGLVKVLGKLSDAAFAPPLRRHLV